MKKALLGIIICLIGLTANSQNSTLVPEVNPIVIQKTFALWQDYQDHHIMLSLDFVALDDQAQNISKKQFLTTLTTGEYFPLKMLSDKNQITTYQLYKVQPTSDTSIKAYMASLAFNELQNYTMEGQQFPAFNYVDLQGNPITNQSMLGNIVVIKCWYIHCAACIKEFSSVNALVSKYQERSDVQFISLAEDTPELLKAFLIKKPLSYSVVPNMKLYMNESLHLNAFPTHFILDKQGKILKVLLNFESLEVALKEVLEKN
jgi:peroxiredoxin